jgi:hypothetical protein
MYLLLFFENQFNIRTDTGELESHIGWDVQHVTVVSVAV